MARVVLAVLVLALGAEPASAIPNSIVEEFNVTTFKDVANTTADWNTAAGKLKLFPYRPTLLANYDAQGFAMGVVISGTVAYMPVHNTGLHMVSIANPSSPTLLARYDTPGSAYGVALSGTVAYVADYLSGLQIINVSNPSSPTLLGSVDTPGFANSVAISGTTAFVADELSGLQVIDASNPASPSLVGTFNTPGQALGVAVWGTRAFVADGTSGLEIYDVSTPASPTLLGTYNTPGSARSVTVSGTVAYVADEGSGLQIINVGNPASPTLLGSYNTPGSALSVTLSGSHAYVADQGSGLLIVDISNPANPALVTSYDTPGFAQGVALSGLVAYVADQGSGLQVLNVNNLVSPTPVGSYDTPGSASAVAAAGTRVYVADAPTGLQVIDITNPASPTLLGTVDTPDFAADVAVAGTIAYVADLGSGLQVIDVSNPSSPVLLGSFDTPNFARGVTVAGTVAYVADNLSGLQIIDVSNPSSPAFLGTFDTPNVAFDVVVAGTVAYVADNTSGLQIIDVSNPASPTLLGTYNASSQPVHDVAVAGTVAYVTASTSGLHIIDVTNPASPTLLGTYDTPGVARNVVIAGTVAYVADQDSGLLVIDVRNPASPTLLGRYQTPSSAFAVALSGNMACVAELSAGFQVIEVQASVDAARNIGRSLAIDGTNDPIAKARLTSTQLNTVGWELSTDGGTSWQSAIPGSDWIGLTPGSNLRWRATLTTVPPQVTGAPEVSRVEVEWLYDFPVIQAITDVGNDQGRQVRLDWRRSAHDFVGSVPQITEYAIFRRIDPGYAALGLDAVVAEHARDPEVAEALAAGWDFVTTVPADAEDDYAVVVPTLADSTVGAGQHWTAFRVRARTATPGVYHDSYPDSGYSLDNFSPPIPAPFTGLFTGGPVQLHWGASPASDLGSYHLHRGSSPGFVPGPTNLVTAQPDTGFIDTGSTWSYYKLSAVDLSGNPSGFALLTPGSMFSAPTPAGTNLTVPLASNVELTFDDVTSGGQTQLNLRTQGSPPPTGLELMPSAPPLYYELTTTATFSGLLTVCVTYDQANVIGNEGSLGLMHYDTALGPPAWVQVTTSRDTVANVICGAVTHLSEFALMRSLAPLDVDERIPSSVRLYSCAPNPLSGPARIRYDLPVALPARLALYDLQGRLVRVLERHVMASAGRHEAHWDGRGVHGEQLRNGIYFLTLDAGGARQAQRLVVTR